MSDKLNIANEMRCFDSKDREFYDSLTDEERKKFSNYLMIRWGSAVQGPSELQEYYLVACNERLNKHFFDINRHPQVTMVMCYKCITRHGQPQASMDFSQEKRKRQQRRQENVNGTVSCNESR